MTCRPRAELSMSWTVMAPLFHFDRLHVKCLVGVPVVAGQEIACLYTQRLFQAPVSCMPIRDLREAFALQRRKRRQCVSYPLHQLLELLESHRCPP